MKPLSKAWEFIKTHKWKAIGLTSVAAGIYWTSRSSQDDRAQEQQRRAFWTDSQSTCDQTIVSFAPLVAKSLNETTKIADLLEQLRKPDLDRRVKVELWDELKGACTFFPVLCFSGVPKFANRFDSAFTYMLASVYSVSLLSAYLRVAVNLISRYLFEAKQRPPRSLVSLVFAFLFRSSSNSDHAAGMEIPVLTADTQRDYLKLTDHFLRNGLPQIVAVILEVAKPELDSLSLKQECSFEDTKILLSTIHAGIQRKLHSGAFNHNSFSFAGTLLPREAERVGSHDTTATQMAALSSIIEEEGYLDSELTSTDTLKLLVNETRNIVESTPFGLVVDACIRGGMHSAFEELRSLFSEAGDVTAAQKIPLAKLIPLVNKHSAALLQTPDNPLVKIVAQVPELNDFCHRVFDDRVFHQ